MAASPAAVGPRDPRLASRPSPGIGRLLWRFIRKKPLGAAGAVIMGAIVVTAIFADLVATHDPVATDAAHTLARPGAARWLGSDNLGRDIYSRIVHGARVSLIVGLASTLLGSALGGVSAFCRATWAAGPIW